MRRRLVIVTEIISPYRIPLFNVLATNPAVDLHVIFLAETDPHLRQWPTYKQEIKFSYQVLPSWRKRIGKYNLLLNRGAAAALAHSGPEMILFGGYNYLASWQCLVWACRHKVPFFLWSESNTQDIRGQHAVVELLKTEFFRRCSGFVVPGRSAFEYLRSHHLNSAMIFVAPNAIDNEWFAAAAMKARQSAERDRSEFSLPPRYFLFVGRLVREKGVFELLSAYAKLDAAMRHEFGLVFVGDGPSRKRLEEQAASITPGTVKFAGFAQREQLAVYYALAEMLILPTYTDTWGLVVNEGMACGLPIVLSRAAGCAADLVRENWNGLLVPPRDTMSLTAAMESLACRPDLRASMGSHSAEQISHYSPQAWADGIVRMIQDHGSSV